MTYLLHQLVTRGAERSPERTAVAGPESALSYAQLEQLSNQIARQLYQDGVRAGDRVGLLSAKSAESVAALLGIQKAGAAYVPVDPYAPPRRASYILNDCAIRALITTPDKPSRLSPDQLKASGLKTVILLEQRRESASASRFGELPVHSLEELRNTQSPDHFETGLTENHLAYILYTSGSTGEPKGVMVSHLNASSFVDWCYATFEVMSSDLVSNHAPFHFDLSVFDLFCTFKAGATVFLVPHSATMFPSELAEWIAEKRISIWYSVPSALIQLLEHGQLDRHSFERLRMILFAGEVFPIRYLRRLAHILPHATYYNLYGPTETNVCTFHRVKPEELDPQRIEPVPIGKACANAQVFALSSSGTAAAEGEEGELYVRGSTVMKGYWNRPQDTAKVLVPNFLGGDAGEVVYRTGDIVRQLPGGDYQYVGRRDKMIKSRGYRIELGEIETVLNAHSHVVEVAAIAVADEKIGNRIKACIVTTGVLKQRELEYFCSQRLPRYMLPEIWEMRSELPKTSTGKIDRAGLERESGRCDE